MMCDTFYEALAMHAADIEAAVPDMPEHKFSLRHRLRMRKFFRNYEKRKTGQSVSDAYKISEEKSKLRLSKKTIITIAVIVLLSLLAGCAAAYFISEAFRGSVHSDNTQIFAVNTDNCPETIEELFSFSELPDRYELVEENILYYMVSRSYIDRETGNTFVFKQLVKTAFTPHLNTEYGELSEITVNDCPGIWLDLGEENNVIAWDTGDYILEISAKMSKDTVFDLAGLLISEPVITE